MQLEMEGFLPREGMWTPNGFAESVLGGGIRPLWRLRGAGGESRQTSRGGEAGRRVVRGRPPDGEGAGLKRKTSARGGGGAGGGAYASGKDARGQAMTTDWEESVGGQRRRVGGGDVAAARGGRNVGDAPSAHMGEDFFAEQFFAGEDEHEGGGGDRPNRPMGRGSSPGVVVKGEVGEAFAFLHNGGGGGGGCSDEHTASGGLGEGDERASWEEANGSDGLDCNGRDAYDALPPPELALRANQLRVAPPQAQSEEASAAGEGF